MTIILNIIILHATLDSLSEPITIIADKASTLIDTFLSKLTEIDTLLKLASTQEETMNSLNRVVKVLTDENIALETRLIDLEKNPTRNYKN